MKVICNRGALLEGLTVASNVINARTPKPVLLNIKFSASADKLTISATDLEVAIRYSDAQVQVEEPGETLLPADMFRDIVRESLDDTLSIEIRGDTAIIKGQDSVFKLPTQSPADFPPVPDFEGETDFEIVAGQLKQLINQTVFAVARESTRYAFNGVLLVAKDKKISFVSTDGRRLAQAKGDIATVNKLPKEGVHVIVHTKALALMEKLLGDPEEVVGFQVRENQIVFKTHNATLTSTLVEGQFPPYEDVIPKDADKIMTAGTADFLSAVRRASLLTSEESKGVRLQFSNKGLVLSTRSADAGEATVNFACKFDGADIEIGFNPAFLVDALRIVDTDEISLEVSAPNRPGLLKSGPNFLYVIMPVNLQ